jgi:hypothetical protein
VPAVFERPQTLGLERARPRDHLVVHRATSLGKRAAELVDGDRRYRVLVHVHSDHDH